MIRYFFLALMMGAYSTKAFAVEAVQFTNKELGAVVTLMRPELNSIELHGRNAIVKPAPSLKYLGVESSSTYLDLSVIAEIVDLEFNHVKAKTPQLKFMNGAFELSVPVEDRVRGVQSALGSISFKDVVLRAQVGWKTRTDGTQALSLISTKFEGTLKGTGVLSSGFILRKTKDLCVVLLTKALKKFLASEKFEASMNTGLVEYGKFYTGNLVRELEAGSIQFFEDGIKYNVN